MIHDVPETANFAALARVKRRRRLVIALLVAVVAVALIVSAVSNSGVTSSLATNARTHVPETIPGTSIIVHIVGAVEHPGLYSLASDSRVVDVVMRAGGLTKTADKCSLNMARVAVDGEQILVPVRSAEANACTVVSRVGDGHQTASRVSLSRATVGELDALPGIGPALAQRIVDWRHAHGGFSSVGQLDSVAGIGARLLEQLTPLVTP